MDVAWPPLQRNRNRPRYECCPLGLLGSSVVVDIGEHALRKQVGPRWDTPSMLANLRMCCQDKKNPEMRTYKVWNLKRHLSQALRPRSAFLSKLLMYRSSVKVNIQKMCGGPL